MPIEIITHNGVAYPALQAKGNAAKWCREFAIEILKPHEKTGYDIGFCKEDWKLPNSIGIDINLDNGYDAMHLPKMNVDYIHSSHCIEHLASWVDALEYWHSVLHEDGILFLYLPDMDKQSYWRPWSNRKHIQYINHDIMSSYFKECGLWSNFFIAGTDLNCSFYCVAEKRKV